jgi:hypothetical protein
MFETRETTFEVFFLRSYVSIKISGTFFLASGKRGRFSYGEIISAGQGCDYI